MSRIEVSNAIVKVETDEVLPEIETWELLDEVRSRNDANLVEWTDEEIVLLEKLYYALRDGTKEDAIKVINPLLDQKIGRRI